MKKITSTQLRRAAACEDQVKLFVRHFGRSVVVTEKLCIEHAQDFDWDWAADSLLSVPARAAYNEATAPAWARAYLGDKE